MIVMSFRSCVNLKLNLILIASVSFDCSLYQVSCSLLAVSAIQSNGNCNGT